MNIYDSAKNPIRQITSDQSGYAYVAWLDEHVTKVSNARTGLLYSNLMKESDKEIEIVIKVEIK